MPGTVIETITDDPYQIQEHSMRNVPNQPVQAPAAPTPLMLESAKSAAPSAASSDALRGRASQAVKRKVIDEGIESTGGQDV